MSGITALLRRVAAEDQTAMDELFALLYDDLHRLAHARMANNRPITSPEGFEAFDEYTRLNGRDFTPMRVTKSQEQVHFLSVIAEGIKGNKREHVVRNRPTADTALCVRSTVSGHQPAPHSVRTASDIKTEQLRFSLGRHLREKPGTSPTGHCDPAGLFAINRAAGSNSSRPTRRR